MKSSRIIPLAISLVMALVAAVALVWAFAEEPLTFRDPYTGLPGAEEISTIHDDLTYVLALAAGFTVTDSKTIRLWNQLVDSEVLGAGNPVSYTNCSGAFYPEPDADIICGTRPHSRQIWPQWSAVKDPDSCTTSRFGPYSPFFHFPHNTPDELGALHDWGWGLTDQLVGYEAYAWGIPGDLTVMNARCLYTRPAVITTGLEAGSLEAFATYLHSLGDHYSHRECIAALDDWGEFGMPWATHTVPPIDPDIPACNYNPANPQPDDVHGREFYTYTDSLRTDEAIQHIYQELVSRSLQKEGVYFPIGMNRPISGTEALGDMLDRFVHQWDFAQPAERRALADEIAGLILARRLPARHTILPLVFMQWSQEG